MLNDQTHTATQPTDLANFSFIRALAPRQLSLHSRTLMLVLSQLIEDTAVRTPQTVLVAAFQRYSLVLPQLARYTHMTPQLAHTYILGLPDIALPALPNATLLPIAPAWPLLHEWVVLAFGPACCVGLFAHDVEQQQPQQRTRAFQGLWTTHLDVVSAAYTAFSAAAGQPLPAVVPDTRATRETTQQFQRAMTARLRQHHKRHTPR